MGGDVELRSMTSEGSEADLEGQSTVPHSRFSLGSQQKFDLEQIQRIVPPKVPCARLTTVSSV